MLRVHSWLGKWKRKMSHSTEIPEQLSDAEPDEGDQDPPLTFQQDETATNSVDPNQDMGVTKVQEPEERSASDSSQSLRSVPPPFLPSIVASSTFVGHRGRQDDACYHLQLPGCNVIAVADGLGSYDFSRIGSHHAVASAVGFIQRVVMGGGLADIHTRPELPEWIVREAIIHAHRDVQHLNSLLADAGEATATTLLLLVEFTDCFVFGGIGDGGVLHLSGDDTYARNYISARWKGDDRMDMVLGSARDITPDIQKIPKLKDSGNFFAVCTDGMAVGFVKKENHKWIMDQPMKISTGVQMIRDEIADHIERMQTLNADVHHILDKWVRGYEVTVADNSVTSHAHDNRTIGVLIDEECQRYWIEHGTALPS